MTQDIHSSKGGVSNGVPEVAGPLWIEAPMNQADWNAPQSCNVVDLRRPRPDPDREGGKGFEAVFTGTFAECDAWLEANG